MLTRAGEVMRCDYHDPRLAEFHVEDMLAFDADKRAKAALLNKLNVDELRVLLVHYDYADKGKGARRWSKAEMVETIAEHMADAEIAL